MEHTVHPDEDIPDSTLHSQYIKGCIAETINDAGLCESVIITVNGIQFKVKYNLK